MADTNRKCEICDTRPKELVVSTCNGQTELLICNECCDKMKRGDTLVDVYGAAWKFVNQRWHADFYEEHMDFVEGCDDGTDINKDPTNNDN
jgi:hypothetical protein